MKTSILTTGEIDAILLRAGTTGERQVWFTRPEAVRAVKAAAPPAMTEEEHASLEYMRRLATDENFYKSRLGPIYEWCLRASTPSPTAIERTK